jgi:hypothetical protein
MEKNEPYEMTFPFIGADGKYRLVPYPCISIWNQISKGIYGLELIPVMKTKKIKRKKEKDEFINISNPGQRRLPLRLRLFAIARNFL